jgi:hypothetical protein
MPDTTLTVPVYREAMTTDSTAVDLLPTWNTDRFFPGLDSREFASDREAVVADLGRLRALYDRHDIRSGASRPVGDEDRSAVAEVLTATNELLERLQTLEAYIYAFVSTDAGNDLAAGEEARLASTPGSDGWGPTVWPKATTRWATTGTRCAARWRRPSIR